MLQLFCYAWWIFMQLCNQIEWTYIFRYLHVRWGIDLSNVVVIAGECGDTDYEGLLGGVHKTVILKGVGESARKLHANRNYSLEDVISFDSHNVIQVDEACDSYDIRASLEKLGVLKGQ